MNAEKYPIGTRLLATHITAPRVEEIWVRCENDLRLEKNGKTTITCTGFRAVKIIKVLPPLKRTPQ